MKKKFSVKWKSSRQPRKQRKYLANAPLHLKKKQLNVNLSKELRVKYGKRSILLKKGDTVKVFRGKFKGKSGKVIGIKIKKSYVEMEGIQIKKKDGSKINVKLKSSNLQIIDLNLEDKKRNKSIKTAVKIIKKENEDNEKSDKKEGGKK